MPLQVTPLPLSLLRSVPPSISISAPTMVLTVPIEPASSSIVIRLLYKLG